MTPPTFVLLRGLTREQRHWGEFPQQLLQQFPTARVITPDLPGNGSACHERSPVTIAGMVEPLRAILKPTLDQDPVIVIALSMGAMAAIEWMQRYPAEIKGAVLMSTSLKGVSPFHHRLRPANYPFLLYSLLVATDPRQRERTILKLTSNLNQNDEVLLQAWCRYVEECPVTRANAWRQLLAAARYRVPECKPEQPLLLLAGAGDRLVDPRCSIALARRWQLPLESHPQAGHDLPLDAGPWVCERIGEWLGRNFPALQPQGNRTLS